MSCIIHYNQFERGEKLVDVTEQTFATLVECKSIRESLGGDNHHIQQCKFIPDTFNQELKYHRQCYQKFTYAKTLAKRKICKEPRKQRLSNRFVADSQNEAKRRKVELSTLFPEHCMFCEKVRITVNKKEQYPKRIETKIAENSVLNAANLRSDVTMLGMINGIDLIAKEFRKHEKCYRDYTRVLFETSTNRTGEEVYDKGNFLDVCSVIDNDVLAERKCISMQTLINIYGIGDGTKQYRRLLKNRLMNKYGNDIIFLSPEYHSTQVIISRKCLECSTISKSIEYSNEFILKKASSLLKQTVADKLAATNETAWPPTVKDLQGDDRKPPTELKQFFKYLFYKENSSSNMASRVERWINSLCSDVMFMFSRGKFLSLKHVSLGLGMHSITGKKEPIVTLHKLGHSISYDQVARIETAQAELVNHLQNSSLELPLQPAFVGAKVTE